MTENAKRPFLMSLFLPLMELVSVCAFLVSFAFYGRHHLVAGNPRDDFMKLLFFACLFGRAFIIEARLYTLLRRGNVLDNNEKPDLRGHWRVRLYIAGYVLLIISAIAMIITINL